MKRIKHLQHLPKNGVYDTFDSPVGLLALFASAQGLHNILWENEYASEACQRHLATLSRNLNHHIINTVKQQLTEYFGGRRQQFDLPLVPTGTNFQLRAWQVLASIPYGQTITYGEQAERLGHRNKARAVGLANGFNPLSIIIPCHRVIGTNGQLTGFGGGLDRKEFLLQLENEK